MNGNHTRAAARLLLLCSIGALTMAFLPPLAWAADAIAGDVSGATAGAVDTQDATTSIDQASEAVKDTTTSTTDQVTKSTQDTTTAVKDTTTKVTDQASSTTTDVTSAVKDTTTKVTDQASSTTTDVTSAVDTTAKTADAAVDTTTNTAVDTTLGATDAAVESGAGATTDLVTKASHGVRGGTTTGTTTVVETASSSGTAVAEMGGRASTKSGTAQLPSSQPVLYGNWDRVLAINARGSVLWSGRVLAAQGTCQRAGELDCRQLSDLGGMDSFTDSVSSVLRQLASTGLALLSKLWAQLLLVAAGITALVVARLRLDTAAAGTLDWQDLHSRR